MKSAVAKQNGVMARIVLDASALLAWIEDEPGGDRVLDALGSGAVVMSAVNWAEVLAKLADRGVSDEDLRRIRGSLDLEIRPFDEHAAFESVALRRATRSLGLSIGDRACLGLARLEEAAALTADRRWIKVDADIEVEVIR